MIPQQTSPVAFPIDVFPGPIRRFTLETAASLRCPADFPAMGALATFAVGAGGRSKLELKSGWLEGPRLWLAVVADPGAGKSPALDAATAPLRGLQAQLFRDWKEQLRAYRSGLARHHVERALWHAEAKASYLGKKTDIGPDPEPPTEPVLRQCLVADVTVEALAPVLAANPDGVLLYADELVGWVRSFNRYRSGQGPDRQNWLSLWSGSPILVNRKSLPEPLIVENPFVCVLGGLTPDGIIELGGRRAVEDGLIERLLISWPEPVSPGWSDATPSVEAVTAFQAAFDFVRQFPDGTPLGPGDRTLQLDADAYRVFAAWADAFLQNSTARFTAYGGARAKALGTCGRLALVVHAMRIACRATESATVETESVAGAIKLMTYFLKHGERVHRSLTPAGVGNLGAAVDWIRRHGGSTTRRQLQHANVAGIRTREDAQELLEELRAAGLGTIQAGSRNSVIFSLTHSDTRQSDRSHVGLSGVGSGVKNLDDEEMMDKTVAVVPASGPSSEAPQQLLFELSAEQGESASKGET